MLQAINNTGDLLKALEQDPELRRQVRLHILDQDFLTLPATVKTLVQITQNVVERQDRLEIVVADLVEKFAAMVERQDRMEIAMAALIERQDRMEIAMAAMIERQDRMEIAMATLIERQDRMEIAMAAMIERQDRMEDTLNEHTVILKRISGTVARLDGKDYESQSLLFAHRLVRRLTGFQPIGVAWKGLDPATAELTAAGRQEGKITDDEDDEIARADLIIRASDPAGQPAFIIGEVSITVQDHDRQRAANRARLLTQATGITAVPVTIGADQEQPNANDNDSDPIQFLHFKPNEPE